MVLITLCGIVVFAMFWSVDKFIVCTCSTDKIIFLFAWCGQYGSFMCLCVVGKFYFLSLCKIHFSNCIYRQWARLDYFQVVFKTMSHSLSILQCRKITIVGIIEKNAYDYCVFAVWGDGLHCKTTFPVTD